MPSIDPLQARELYGGAMTCKIPERFLDVSDFRPIPDHQEAMADGSTDQSVVIEIVEALSMDNSSCGRYYFTDMAEMNESLATSIEQVEELGQESLPGLAGTPGLYACLVTGTQLVAKGREAEEARNQVLVLMAVIRLPQVSSDLMFTLNAPLHISPSSSSAEHAGPGAHLEPLLTAKPLMLAMLASLQIHDWGLFGGVSDE